MIYGWCGVVREQYLNFRLVVVIVNGVLSEVPSPVMHFPLYEGRGHVDLALRSSVFQSGTSEQLTP